VIFKAQQARGTSSTGFKIPGRKNRHAGADQTQDEQKIRGQGIKPKVKGQIWQTKRQNGILRTVKAADQADNAKNYTKNRA
jgi:hypothetical protein